ncbi:hypothetical protein J2755_000435 [Methanohalophilus levihalophilus]|uniref:PEP/pyruvate-binding domain-containing protein n=1 Tax=Methanohalophilus levihalophilus TaxID=1431282 RepID=UPI001AEA3870|nr:PEP/pyruvate-binding domain-containing protein [Methanohalophilus levihalophilus]MBP2029515.1 hypothetical protein [Methanohalophilus levihalophilus]
MFKCEVAKDKSRVTTHLECNDHGGSGVESKKVSEKNHVAEYEQKEKISSGVGQLDEILHYFRLGDNVVWKIEELDDYRHFANKFVQKGLDAGYKCVYIRFAPHEPILQDTENVEIVTINPSPGFDYFSSQVHHTIEKYGEKIFYVFDNLSSLVTEWATDELLADFFKVTCPYLFELDTIAYFALTKGRHSHSAVAAIRDTTQILLSYYHVGDNTYLHPLKVYARYSPDMYLPHLVSEEKWKPVFNSGEAAAVSSTERKKGLKRSIKTIAPWESVYSRLKYYYAINPESRITDPDILALKQELSRMVIGNHPRFNKLADEYFTLEDLLSIRDRIIGSGRVGGKAAGMLLARSIVIKSNGKKDFRKIMESHDSFYIGSDVFFTFLIKNDLFRLKVKMAESSDMSREEFEEVEQKFLEGKFPEEIVEEFRDMLDYFGQAPIIARSSSLQEDSFGNAFAGKYRSEFCANQGTPDERLEAFMHAVKLVYASALNPDALSYRRKRGLQNEDEQMAILVQRVAGIPYKQYFFPALAGVTFSRNLFTWTKRIDPNKGMVRLVFGLGTRAVDRVGRDYPRMIAVSHPGLRPEAGNQITKYSQWEVDVIDFRKNNLETVHFRDLVEDCDYPNLGMFVSILTGGYLTDPYKKITDCTAQQMVLTFNNLISKTDFIPIIEEMLATIERVYEQPVDIEFTASLDPEKKIKLNIVQCRPMTIPGITGQIEIPQKIPATDILFRSDKIINGGTIENIGYILYIEPTSYDDIEDMDIKKSIGRVVGHVNEKMRSMNSSFIMMGPGRWGSSNIELGVNVTYSEIDGTSVLVEIAREKAGHTPEVSYGTHFFQDLVEGQIIYMPAYPDRKESEFNELFFKESGNLLPEILPRFSDFANVIKLIDVRKAADGASAVIAADPQAQKAICYLKKD